ncbi:MAG: PAS domain S-box protein [Candidatus Coatesbacteria bacterium]|nr:MAG: PAS domain S-box protein [Candidatus Coatesbacteria bacterium]
MARFKDIGDRLARRLGAGGNDGSSAEPSGPYRDLHDNVPLGLFRTTVDDGGRFLSANPALARILGYGSAEQLLGLRMIDFFLDSRERVTFVERVTADGAVAGFRAQFRCRGGEYFWGAINARAVSEGEGGKVRYIDGSLEDVTDLVRLEMAREMQRDRALSALRRFQAMQDDADVELWKRTSSAVRDLQSVLDHAGVLLWALREEEGELVFEQVNDAFADVAGRDPEYYAGQAVAEVVTPEQLDVITQAYASVNEGEPKTFNAEWGEGSEARQYIVRIIPVSDTGGQGRRFITSATDVTELKQAEEGLRELQRANDTLTDLVVHDIKNISSTMFAWLELMRDGDLGALTPDQREALARIIERNEELVSLSEELLDIARAAEGGITVDTKPYVLEDQVREIIEELEPAGAKEGKVIRRRVYGGPVVVQADEARVRRVLANLLNNALRFIPAKEGRVMVTLKKEGARGFAVVRITDNGPGIPKEFQDIVFEKFRQVELRDKGLKKGTGLGLTFCKMAVEAHGGTIRVESDGRNGSSFIFTLPLYHP